jgi:hypothetical protein
VNVDREPDPKVACPHCGKPVDPLRAAAVSIIDGRISHFCSAECRERHLRRAKDSAPSPSPPPARTAGRSIDTADEAPRVDPLDLASRASSLPRSPILVRESAWMAALFAVAAGALALELWGGRIAHLAALCAAGAAALACLATGLVRERSGGLLRVVEAAAFPFSAIAIAAASSLGGFRGAGAAVALLAAERAGRLVETIGRLRSGVLASIDGRAPSPLAESFRDNSTLAARAKTVAQILAIARFPLAALFGLFLRFALHASPSHALLASAIALIALGPRALRMATGDAHLGVAIAAAARNVAIRDADAVDHAGASRVFLFFGPGVLVSGEMTVVDFRVAEGVREADALDALHAVETGVQGRVATAISRFAGGRGGAGEAATDMVVSAGLGVCGTTRLGRVVCGARELLLASGIATGELEEAAHAVEETGRRAVFLGWDERLAAVFGVQEEPLQGARDMALRLASQGFEPALITSAEVDAAHALGARLGIEHVRFDSDLERTGRILGELADAGESVVLVGRGPAFEENLRLAAASIAVGGDEPTLASFELKGGDVREVPWIAEACADARSSVFANLAVLTAAGLVGLAVAAGWHTPASAVLIGAACAMAAGFTTINSPFPLVDAARRRIDAAVASAARRIARRVAGR